MKTDVLRPGYSGTEEIWESKPWVTDETIRFMQESGVSGSIVDIGEYSLKSEAMSEIWEVHQADSGDFNFERPNGDGKHSIITCFEVIEHLQNPMTLLKNIKDMMPRDGTLFLSTPGRPKFMWYDGHFHEMSPKHLEKWLLTPLGLKIIRKKRIRINNPSNWRYYLTGFRPFLRLFLNFTWIYEIKKHV